MDSIIRGLWRFPKMVIHDSDVDPPGLKNPPHLAAAHQWDITPGAFFLATSRRCCKPGAAIPFFLTHIIYIYISTIYIIYGWYILYIYINHSYRGYIPNFQLIQTALAHLATRWAIPIAVSWMWRSILWAARPGICDCSNWRLISLFQWNNPHWGFSSHVGIPKGS